MTKEHQIPRIDYKDPVQINMGAEAKVYDSVFLDYKVVIKHRIAKKYREESIDRKLRKDRTIQEVRLLQLARGIGINVPYVLDVDKVNWVIVMDKVAGSSIKHYMESNNLEKYFIELGKIIGKLHSSNIIHGDLTTSNIVLDPTENIWIIDFGLGFISHQIEDKAVDLLVLKHTIESSHYSSYELAYGSLIKGYQDQNTQAEKIFKRLKIVEARVRYRKHEA